MDKDKDDEPKIHLPTLTAARLGFLITVLWFVGKGIDLAVAWADKRAEEARRNAEHSALYSVVMDSPTGLKDTVSRIDKSVSAVNEKLSSEWTARTDGDTALHAQIADMRIQNAELRARLTALTTSTTPVNATATATPTTTTPPVKTP